MTKIEKNTQLQKALDNLISEIKKLSEACSDETDFNKYLIEEVAPKLTENNLFYSSSVFSKLNLAVELSQSELDNKNMSLENAMNKMNDEAVCWLLDHLWSCRRALTVLSSYRKGHPTSEEEAKTAIHALESDAYQLQGWLNQHLYERIQDYNNEIKELRGRN